MPAERTTHEAEAYALGVEHAKNAASWVIDGNTKREAIPAVLALMDDGDPRADDYLPARPNLSGEWVDDLTPRSLYERIVGELPAEGDEGLDFETLHGSTLDRIADAYEAGVLDTFEVECERILRDAIS